MKRATLLADGRLAFECPGCGDSHEVPVNRHGRGAVEQGPAWDWNGSLDKPTLGPSILVRWGSSTEKRCCHSYVRGGRIEFLSDCTHALAGQTVDLPEIAD